MISSFKQILDSVKQSSRKTVAVAAAEDEPVLEAVIAAHESGIVNAILVGDKSEIYAIAYRGGLELPENSFEIIDVKNKAEAARIAVEMVVDGKADMVMKGLLETSVFLKAVLNKEKGLRTGKVLSHVAIFEVPALGRLLLLTDAAMNIAPDLATKKQILENAVGVAKGIGMELPRVAVICAVETVNPDMPATLDAAALSKMCDRGQIKGCLVDGPLALDNAVSVEAARHKGIMSRVAGEADILLVPDIEAGNVMYKTLTFMGNAKNGGILAGAAAPVILTSRTDSAESKLYSIALAALTSGTRK